MTKPKVIDQVIADEYAVYNADCVGGIDLIPDEAIGLSVFSPPFPGLYAYTDSAADMGNVADISEMLDHFRFLVDKDKMLRVLQPGRSVCVHLTQIPRFKYLDGHVGLKDFRGDLIRLMEECGWIYYGEVTIDKDPQVKAMRTKDATLQFKSLATDSNRMRMALADYIVVFKKPGDNANPIRAGISTKYKNPDGWITSEEWIEWAAPVWYRQTEDYPGGIRETDVLSNYRSARCEDDEKHLCPLQIGVIERCVKLWSAPGDTVLSPFTGIGSEGYVSVKHGRRFVGFELKPSYWKIACENLDRAAREFHAGSEDLFDLADTYE